MFCRKEWRRSGVFFVVDLTSRSSQEEVSLPLSSSIRKWTLIR